MAKRQAPRRRRAERRENRRLLIWLLVCFPFGLVLMWRRSCRWPLAAKCAVTAALALLVTAIVLPQTTPTRKVTGGVQLVGREPSVEIYGPELPEDLDGRNYESILYSAATSVPVATPVPETYVYVAGNGKYYHTAQCRYYQYASRKLSLYEAYFTDYKPCPECNPGVWQR